MSESKNIISNVKHLKNMIRPDGQQHVWHFSRVGGVNRVNLETGRDLVSLEYLDQKLWTALSCPVHGLEIDYRTLELIDTDKDGRIRVPEIVEAIKWLTAFIKDPDDLLKDTKSLPISAINDSTDEGKKLLASAKQILANLGKAGADRITVEETSNVERIFKDTKFNGDGIITENSTDDEKMKKLIADIMTFTGSSIDRNGKPGISIDHVHAFFKHCEDYSNWFAKAEADAKRMRPYGDQTLEALNALEAVKTKIEDYFLRCRLAEFDPASAEILNALKARYEGISAKDLSASLDEIAGFPLARIEAGKPLPLNKGLNPAWEKAMNRFIESVVRLELGDKDSLTESEWNFLRSKFDAYTEWRSEKAGAAVEKLGLSAIRELLSGNSKQSLIGLIEQDKALEENANYIFLVDKLARYYRDLYTLLKNYVTFSDFYSPDAKAIFQAGSLYIDQRCCDLCIEVSDMDKHSAMAKLSGLCLIYCSCYSKTKNKTMIIAAALTDGDIDNIEVGRNAIFYDRQGSDWDATIIKVVSNPISIRQAFWSPYIKVSKFISAQIDKVASSKEKEVESVAASKVEQATTKVETGIAKSVKPQGESQTAGAPTAQPFDIGKFVGIFAAISLALGAIGSVVASILTGFFGLVWWKMPLAIIGIVLCISGPSMVIAWLKLRKRNLAPLLDANGWAINARATINIPFGNTLTHLAALPENARLNLLDPFAKKKRPVIPIMLTILVLLAAAGYVLWYYGYLSEWGIWPNNLQ